MARSLCKGSGHTRVQASGRQSLDLVGARVARQETDRQLVTVGDGGRSAAGVAVLVGLAGAVVDQVGPQLQHLDGLGQRVDGYVDPPELLLRRTAVAELQALACHSGAGGDLVGGQRQSGTILAQQRVGLVGVVALADVVQPGGRGRALVGGGAVDGLGLGTVGGTELPVRQHFAGEVERRKLGGCGHQATPSVVLNRVSKVY